MTCDAPEGASAWRSRSIWSGKASLTNSMIWWSGAPGLGTSPAIVGRLGRAVAGQQHFGFIRCLPSQGHDAQRYSVRVGSQRGQCRGEEVPGDLDNGALVCDAYPGQRRRVWGGSPQLTPLGTMGRGVVVRGSEAVGR